MLDMLQYAFVQRALAAGCLIALCCALMGVFLVMRRYSLIGEGLSHFTFAAVGLALLVGVAPLYLALPLVAAASLAIARLSECATVHTDAAIGMVASVGVAVGVVLASVGGGFNVDLFSYLFGDILAVTRTEVALSVGLCGVVAGTVLLFYQELFVGTVDEEYAKTAGVKTDRVGHMLVVLTAVTVVLGMRIAGTLLVSSLIVLPSVTALQVSRSFRGALALAAGLGVFSVLAGVTIAFQFNLPAGATIVLVNALLFAAAFAAGRLRGRG